MRIDGDPTHVIYSPPPDNNGQPRASKSGDIATIFAPIELGRLIRQHPDMRPVIIDKLAREGEIINIIAPAKRGKSWTVIDLVLCIVAGLCWLGLFVTRKGKVLVLDNELHPETLAKRYRTVLSARGLVLDQVADHLQVVSLRGRLQNVHQLAAYLLTLEPGEFGAVVIDAMYRALPVGCDENKNSDMAAVYNVLERAADHLRAVIIIVHHSSKGIQGNKSVTDTGSGAGAISRAVDTHLILREHEEKDCVVMEAAARSFPPLDPLCLRWTFPTWTPAPDLDPTKLKRDRPARRERAPKEAAEPTITWTVQDFANLLTSEPQDKDVLVGRAVTQGVTERTALRLAKLAMADGLAHRWAFPKDRTVYLANIEQPVTATATPEGA